MAGLTLSHLMTEEQLGKLINLCIGSELPWAPHALACLLQDVINVVYLPNTESDMETDTAPPSTSWGAGNVLIFFLQCTNIQERKFSINSRYSLGRRKPMRFFRYRRSANSGTDIKTEQ